MSARGGEQRIPRPRTRSDRWPRSLEPRPRRPAPARRWPRCASGAPRSRRPSRRRSRCPAVARRRCSSRCSRRAARRTSSSPSGPTPCPPTRARSPSRGAGCVPVSTPASEDAALREAEEEIGLPPAAVEVVAELDTLATVGSRFTITPFVGLIDPLPPLVPHPGEVVRILEVPLSDLLEDDAFHEEYWGSPDRAISFFELPGETVWGATARVPGLVPRPSHCIALTVRRRAVPFSFPDASEPSRRRHRRGGRDRDRQVGAPGLRVRRHRHRPQPPDARSRGHRHHLGARRLPLRAPAHGGGDGRRHLAGDRDPHWASWAASPASTSRACGPATRIPTRSSRRSRRWSPTRPPAACRRSTPSRSRRS